MAKKNFRNLMSGGGSQDSTFQMAYLAALEARARGEFALAAQQFEDALRLATELGDSDERVYNSLVGLARCEYRLGKRVEAEEHYQNALMLMQDHLADADPNRLASVLWELAVLYTDLSRFDQAIYFFEQSLDISKTCSGPADRFVADCLWGLSKCYGATRQLEQAESAIREALTIYKQLPDNVDDFIITNITNLVTILIERQKYPEAASEIEQIIKLREESRSSSDDNRETANLYCQMALCLQKDKNYTKATSALRKALKITKQIEGTKSATYALTEVALAHNLNCQGKLEKAEAMLKRAVAFLESNLIRHDQYDSDLAGAMYELSLCYARQDKTKLAIELLDKLLAIHEEHPVANPELFADTLFQLASCCEKALDYRRANKLYERAINIRAKIYGNLHEEVAAALMQRARCLRMIDEPAEAALLQEQAEQILAIVRSKA